VIGSAETSQKVTGVENSAAMNIKYDPVINAFADSDTVSFISSKYVEQGAYF
jgi:hypothetical protein